MQYTFKQYQSVYGQGEREKKPVSSNYMYLELVSKIQIILLCQIPMTLEGNYDGSMRLASRQLHLDFQKKEKGERMDSILQASNTLVYVSGLCYTSSYPPDISRALCQILQMLSTKNNC